MLSAKNVILNSISDKNRVSSCVYILFLYVYYGITCDPILSQKSIHFEKFSFSITEKLLVMKINMLMSSGIYLKLLKKNYNDLDLPMTLITFKVVLVTMGINFSFLLFESRLFICLLYKTKKKKNRS